jgi:hypothetical protein
MFNQNLLKAKMVECGKSALFLSNEIGVCEATFYRKIARQGDFTRFEIEKIINALQLTLEEMNKIFFTQKLT